jgi:hemerythrin
MAQPATQQEVHVRAVMMADHRELEGLLDAVIQAFESGDREAVAAVWTRFDRQLLAHFAAEERYLIPTLLSSSPRAAAAILAEHRHLRARLVELGAGVDLHIVNLRMARGFIDDLRAHAAHEDRTLYRWADEQAADSIRLPLIQAVDAAPSTDSRVASNSST